MIGDKKGFTILELLITITVFSIVITSAIGLFGSALSNQKKLTAEADLLGGASYATEYISRALRMARKDMQGECIMQKDNFATFEQNSRIRFLNYENKCQEFLLDDERIITKKSYDGDSANLGSGYLLTSTSSLLVVNLNFIIKGNNQNDNLQPRVNFALDLRSNISDTILKVQTGVSQRELDFAY